MYGLCAASEKQIKRVGMDLRKGLKQPQRDYADLLTEAQRDFADDLIRFFAQDASVKSMFSTHTPLGYSAVRGMQEDGTDGPVFKQKLTFLSHELATSAMPSPTPSLAQFVGKTDMLLTKLASLVVAKMLQKCPVELAGDLPIFQEGSPTSSMLPCTQIRPQNPAYQQMPMYRPISIPDYWQCRGIRQPLGCKFTPSFSASGSTFL